MKPKINTSSASTNKKGLLISLGIVLVVVLGVFSWWAYGNLRTFPLGDRLQYLGKQEIGGGLFFYATRYTVYYYGTDMTIKEVVDYFQDAKVDDPSELEGVQESGGIPDLSFTNNKTGKRFAIRYDTARPHTLVPYHIQNYSQKYVMSITSLNYEIAKDSL